MRTVMERRKMRKEEKQKIGKTEKRGIEELRK